MFVFLMRHLFINIGEGVFVVRDITLDLVIASQCLEFLKSNSKDLFVLHFLGIDFGRT